MKKIKIIYIIDKLILAGAQTQLIHLLSSMNHDKYDIRLICTDAGGPLEEIVSDLNIPIDIIGIPNWNSFAGLMGFISLGKILRQFRPDIVHTYLFTPNIFGVLAAKIFVSARIISSRRDLGDWMNARQIKMCNFSNIFVDMITANSEAVKSAAVDIENTRNKPIRVLYNAIRMSESQDQIKKITSSHSRVITSFPSDISDAIKNTDFLVGTLSNIRAEKDPMTLLRAFDQMHKKVPNAVLLYAGGVKDKDLFSKMQRWIHQRNLQTSIFFLGPIIDIAGFLKSLDIFVFCSESEGFSNAILEAQYFSLPVIASKAGGNVEQVVHGETGYLFDIGDYQFCAMCMIKLTIGDRYVTMGKAAADRVNETFSTNRMLTSFMNMYDEILKLE